MSSLCVYTLYIYIIVDSRLGAGEAAAIHEAERLVAPLRGAFLWRRRQRRAHQNKERDRSMHEASEQKLARP